MIAMPSQDNYTIDYIKRAISADVLEQPREYAKDFSVLEALYEAHREGGHEQALNMWRGAISRYRPDLAKIVAGDDKDQPQFDEEKHKPDDDELSLLIAHEWDNQFAYFHGEWRKYDNGCWRSRQQPEIHTAVRLLLRRFRRQGVAVSQSRIKAIASMLMDDVFVPDRDVMDTMPQRRKYIPLQNGIFNIDDMTMEDHNPKLFFVNQLDFEYIPSAKCPNFERFLHTSLVTDGTTQTDEEMILFLQEALAYSMTARTDLKASFWLYGKPDSGKSTLLSFIRSLMGNLHGTIDLNSLGGNRFMLSEIIGRRVVTFSEADQGVMLPDGLYKALVGGTDEIFADVKNKPGVTFVPEAKLWWAMNNAPRTTDRSGATINRLKPILFTRSVPKDQRIKDLDRILASEVSGVFNWLLAGYQRLIHQGRFTEPKASTAWLEDYKIREDTELSFSLEVLNLSPNLSIQSSELYSAYRDWCDKNGFKSKNINQFSLDAERLGLEKYVKNGRRFWRGADVKHEWTSNYI
jgi:P4 family phage/plasmid primase-like protien